MFFILIYLLGVEVLKLITANAMHVSRFFYPALLAASGADALRSDKVKLSNIQSLTLRKGKLTSARRVDPIPQVRSTPAYPAIFKITY